MMAGMITLILTGLLRRVRTQRSLVFENLALRHQLAVLPAHRSASTAADLRPALLGLAVPPVERLGRCRLRGPTRHRDPALLDLEEPAERTRPRGSRRWAGQWGSPWTSSSLCS